jgi:Zn ribbon nucleic-acid-binding protein
VIAGPADDDVNVKLSGNLDETTKFPNIKPRLSQRIVLDCQGLDHMSSYAAQQWALWMRSFDQRQQFVLRNLPPRTVDLINMVEDFLPKETTIETFYIPYECADCGYEELQLATRGRDFLEAQPGQAAVLRFAKEINCPKCKNVMNLGVWEHKYLRFLQTTPES